MCLNYLFYKKHLTNYCSTFTNVSSKMSVHKTMHQDKFNLSLSFCVKPGDLFGYVQYIHPNERGFYDLD